MHDDVRCPVCGRPAARLPCCPECNWPLNTGPRAGTVTAAMWREFEARLRQARKDQAERDERTLRAALGDLVAALRPDREASVVAVGKDRIEVSTIYLDGVGTPRLHDARHLPWTAVVPRLPAAESERHAVLAAGGAGLDRDRIATLVRERLSSGRGGGALVVAQPAGWRTLEAAAEAAANAGRPPARLVRIAGTGDVPVRSLLAKAADRAPLRRPYYLLTASVDASTGEVRPRPRQLFAVGAPPGTEQTLTLRRMPGDVADATLAIFAGNGLTDWSAAAPLAMYQVPVPAGPELALRAVLDGPGRVRITEPPGAVTHPDTWKQVFGRIPARVATAATPVDLVCTIDLAGDMDTVLRRKGLVRDLIQLVADEYPDEGRLRVAIVTCTDHVFGRRRGQEKRPVTQTSELGAAAGALTWVAATEGVDRSYDLCAPVEDLLHESHVLLRRSMGSGRRLRLVTLAGRPPHPYPQPDGDEIACPLRLSWREIVQDLGRLGTRCVVVVDELPRTRTQARADWDRIGPAGQYSLPTATARHIAEGLGLFTSEDQRIPLPLTDTHEGS
jgi:hypothetical protein